MARCDVDLAIWRKCVAKISLKELSTRVRDQAITKLVTDVIADDDPWLFRNEAGSYQAFKDYLREHLNDPNAHVLVVGSTKYGFSIAPEPNDATVPTPAHAPEPTLGLRKLPCWTNPSRGGTCRGTKGMGR